MNGHSVVPEPRLGYQPLNGLYQRMNSIPAQYSKGFGAVPVQKNASDQSYDWCSSMGKMTLQDTVPEDKARGLQCLWR
jgi:hypothetical protein